MKKIIVILITLMPFIGHAQVTDSYLKQQADTIGKTTYFPARAKHAIYNMANSKWSNINNTVIQNTVSVDAANAGSQSLSFGGNTAFNTFNWFSTNGYNGIVYNPGNNHTTGFVSTTTQSKIFSDDGSGNQVTLNINFNGGASTFNDGRNWSDRTGLQYLGPINYQSRTLMDKHGVDSLITGATSSLTFSSSSDQVIRNIGGSLGGSNNFKYNESLNNLTIATPVTSVGSGTRSNNQYIGDALTDSTETGSSTRWTTMLGEGHTIRNRGSSIINDSYLANGYANALRVNASQMYNSGVYGGQGNYFDVSGGGFVGSSQINGGLGNRIVVTGGTYKGMGIFEGSDHVLTNADRSGILFGVKSRISGKHSVAIGGYGLTDNGDSSTVVLPYLKLGYKPIIADTTGFLIGYRSSDGKAVRIHKSSLSSGLTTASNGLNVSGTTAKLGGSLTDSTTITLDKPLHFYGNKGFIIGKADPYNDPLNPGLFGSKGPVRFETKDVRGILMAAGNSSDLYQNTGSADTVNHTSSIYTSIYNSGTYVTSDFESSSTAAGVNINANYVSGQNSGIGFSADATGATVSLTSSDPVAGKSASVDVNSTGGILISATDGIAIQKPSLTATVGQTTYLVTSQSTGDDPTVEIRQLRTTTTTSSPASVNLYQTNVFTDEVFACTAWVVARRTGGASGTNGDCAMYRLDGLFHIVGGTLSQVGTTTTTTIAESQAAWDATFNTSGTFIRVQFTGASSNNITWHVYDSKIAYLNN